MSSVFFSRNLIPKRDQSETTQAGGAVVPGWAGFVCSFEYRVVTVFAVAEIPAMHLLVTHFGEKNKNVPQIVFLLRENLP